MLRQRSSVRSHNDSSSSIASNQNTKRVKDCCRKTVAFMCTQVGVGIKKSRKFINFITFNTFK